MVSLQQKTVERTIPVGNYPSEMKIANGKLYVASTYSHRLDVIDLATFETSTVEGFLAPMALAVSPDESRVFVGAGRRLDVIDTSSDQIVDGISLREGPGSRIGPASTLAIDGELLVVGVVDEVRGYDLDLNHGFTILADYLVSKIALGPGNRLYVTTDLTLGQFLVGSLDPPVIYRKIDLEPDLRVTSFWGDVRVASSGRVFVAGPATLYVIDPLRLAVTRRLSFNDGGCAVSPGPRPGCTHSGGGIAYTALDLAPCPNALPTLTPPATETLPPRPTQTPTDSATPTLPPTSTPTGTGTATPSPTATTTSTAAAAQRRQSEPTGGGCSLGHAHTHPSWLMLGPAVLMLWRAPRRTRWRRGR